MYHEHFGHMMNHGGHVEGLLLIILVSVLVGLVLGSNRK